MKKRNIGLCAVALFCMHNNAKAMEPTLKQDNTKVVNHAQVTAAYKTNRPAVKNRLYARFRCTGLALRATGTQRP